MRRKIKKKRSFGMKHFDEDTILKFSLEILDDEEAQKVRNHLSECEICTAVFDDLENQNKLIASYNPKLKNLYVPISKKQNTYSVWFKRAAILLIGFLLGYYTSTILQPEQITVVEQNLVSKSPQNTSTNFTVCPFIDIYRVGLDL
jgi:hypothetical protein